MTQTRAAQKYLLFLVLLGFTLLINPCLSFSAQASFDLLKTHIIAYNIKDLERSVADGNYRGEEGIMCITPRSADSLGMKVYMDDDYLDSIRLYEDAEKFLEEAKNLMASREKEKHSGYYVERIADTFLSYKKSMEQAEEKIMVYRSRLHPGVDERLDPAVSERHMERLLEESLAKTGFRLRDGLGYFYNRCRGLDKKKYPLTPENVQFVNAVFNDFLAQADEISLSAFDLDRNSGYHISHMPSEWKKIAGPGMLQFADELEAACRRFGKEIYEVDPLLFMALLKKESDFDPFAVSWVGAAGLAQIMPRTAKGLGMDNIHVPKYYLKAESLIKQEREARDTALSALFRIDESNKEKYARQARKWMQSSLDLAGEREKLFSRYRRDLLKKMTDDRLQPDKAIQYGFRYFARLMKEQGGDISLALASYNAGPHRVKKYKGIPPFSETVGFRNRILKYYEDYRDRLEKRGGLE